MPYYKKNNEIYWLDSVEEESFLPVGCVLITDEEADNIRSQNQKQEFNNLSYAEKRLREYPTIGDQLDALFHAGIFPDEMAAKIQAVKDKYPKGK